MKAYLDFEPVAQWVMAIRREPCLRKNVGVARGYRVVDRDQAFLLPPDMRDWLPGDHLVWFVLDTVDELDTRAFVVETVANDGDFLPRPNLARS
jgi:hypothetical protein